MINFFAYFWAGQNGTWIGIINQNANSNDLAKNIRGNHASALITFSDGVTSLNAPKLKEIKKAFLAIPTDLLKVYVKQYNEDRKWAPAPDIADNMLNDLLGQANKYQDLQDKITQNEAIITTYEIAEANGATEYTTLADYEKTEKAQIVGKLKELDPDKQKDIKDQLNDLSSKYETYDITAINLKGYADASEVTSAGKIYVKENFNNHLEKLRKNWLLDKDSKDLPQNYDEFKNRLKTNMVSINKDANPTKEEILTDETLKDETKVANRAYAFTRSIMQVSRMGETEINQLYKGKEEGRPKLVLDLRVSKIKWDEETRWGIKFGGIWTTASEKIPTKFTVTNEKAEIMMHNSVTFAIQYGNKTKIFDFEKRDNIKPNGDVNNISTLTKMVDEGNLWTHGVPKNRLTELQREKKATEYSWSDQAPYIYINMDSPPTNAQAKATYDKIANSNLKNPDAVPSVDELFDLYTKLWWTAPTGLIEKFKTVF